MQEPVNPYAPPQAEPSRQDSPDSSELDDFIDASGGARFLNLIIDIVCRLVFAFVLGGVLGAAGIKMGQVENFVFSLCSLFVYYVLFETLFGRTPGKLVTGTRVVKMDGSPLTLGDVITRTLCRFVPFEALSFLGNSRGWHDRWSGTRVINVRR